MLFVVFKAGDTRYALDVERVVEVVPRILLQRCPGAPEIVAGLFSYRGTCVPVIDLCRILAGRPCKSNLGSRVIVSRYKAADGRERLVGFLAEVVSETTDVAEAEFGQAGVAPAGIPFLGRLAIDDTGMLQRVHLDRVLPDALDHILFDAPGKEVMANGGRPV